MWWKTIHHELREVVVDENLWGLAGTAKRAAMAFIRKRGSIYYLVHNRRQQGRVRQLYLARLGRRARINDEVIEEVTAKHPFVHVDWKRLRERVARELVQPATDDSRYLRGLVSTVRNAHLEISDLQLPELNITTDRELRLQLTSELKLLQGTLNLKLRELPRRK